MPVPGLSLVGFYDEARAIDYLRRNTVQDDQSDAALAQCWKSAQQRLGPPDQRSGNPDIVPLKGHEEYLAGVEKNPRFASTVAGSAKWQFAFVEIAPVLAFQADVWLDRVDELCQACTDRKPTDEDALTICLPHDIEQVEPPKVLSDGRSFLIDSPSLNYRVLEGQYIREAQIPDKGTLDIGGIFLGAGSPLVQVTRFADRCYLRNGYHRAIGLQRAGVSHIPCLLLDVPNPAQIGLGPGFFGPDVLQSANPPTCGHYDGRAYPVSLYRKRRQIYLTWSEYVLSE